MVKNYKDFFMNIDREKLLIEEVKIIQDIIKRMASNSFSIKTWTVTLIVATLLIRGSNNHIFIAFIPLFAFWFLDAYYLQQERIFRKIYNWIIDYRLIHDDKLFSINPTKFKNDVESVFKIMFSISILPFYGSIFVLLIIYVLNDFKIFSCILDCIQKV